MKLIVQLKRNAYAIEWSFARVQIRDLRDEDDEPEEDEEALDEAQMRQDPAGSVYCQVERRSDHERPADWVVPIEAEVPDPYKGFGFGS